MNDITPAERKRLIVLLHMAIKLLEPTYDYNVTEAARSVGRERPMLYTYSTIICTAALAAMRSRRNGRPRKEQPTDNVPWWQE